MNKWLFSLAAALLISAIAYNFYIFYVQKDYQFTVEASCDPADQACFVRDCSDGECPENNLEMYRVFTLSAKDFSRCEDASCIDACTAGNIQCQEVKCGESSEDTCTGEITE